MASKSTTDQTIDGRQHLPRDQRGPAGQDHCPSQHLSLYGLLCPCVKSGVTYQIATKLPSLPTLYFVPPTSIHGWRREFENLVDTNHPVMKKLRFSVMHHDMKGDETYFHNSDRVQQTMAKAIRCYTDDKGQPDCYLPGKMVLATGFC